MIQISIQIHLKEIQIWQEDLFFRLVTMVPLGLALRFVLDAVKRPTDSNMYFFGVAALDRFRTRLKDYPQYCQHITCIEHFKEFPAHLVEWVEFGQQSATPPNKPHGPVLPPQLEALVKGQPPPTATSAAPPGRLADRLISAFVCTSLVQMALLLMIKKNKVRT